MSKTGKQSPAGVEDLGFFLDRLWGENQISQVLGFFPELPIKSSEEKPRTLGLGEGAPSGIPPPPPPDQAESAGDLVEGGVVRGPNTPVGWVVGNGASSPDSVDILTVKKRKKQREKEKEKRGSDELPITSFRRLTNSRRHRRSIMRRERGRGKG
ncbi:uncharacterized protein LOC116187161 [Punica granatum]|uniref:Uncharacterized protein LOC116187161 n=1 Tax=Punica granatum TaxID=22663 RepID=A0A6P8BP53_PUNGR|nr:uncharacterized protein LOC116187161 [Punica granatum]